MTKPLTFHAQDARDGCPFCGRKLTRLPCQDHPRHGSFFNPSETDPAKRSGVLFTCKAPKPAKKEESP